MSRTTLDDLATGTMVLPADLTIQVILDSEVVSDPTAIEVLHLLQRQIKNEAGSQAKAMRDESNIILTNEDDVGLAGRAP